MLYSMASTLYWKSVLPIFSYPQSCWIAANLAFDWFKHLVLSLNSYKTLKRSVQEVYRDKINEKLKFTDQVTTHISISSFLFFQTESFIKPAISTSESQSLYKLSLEAENPFTTNKYEPSFYSLLPRCRREWVDHWRTISFLHKYTYSNKNPTESRFTAPKVLFGVQGNIRTHHIHSSSDKIHYKSRDYSKMDQELDWRCGLWHCKTMVICDIQSSRLEGSDNHCYLRMHFASSSISK